VELERLERERLERELELWLWSWSGWSAHEKVRTLFHFLACFAVALLCRNTASSGARLRSFAATQQASELGSGALLRVALLRVALRQRSKLRSQAPELYCALLCGNATSSGARLRSFAARCFAARCLLRVALLHVTCCVLLCRNAASSGARLRSFAARCVAASSGARLRSLLRVALLQRSKLRSLASELAARCFAATQQASEPGSGALLRVALPQRSKL